MMLALLAMFGAAPALAEGWRANDAGVSVRVWQADPFPAEVHARARAADDRGWATTPSPADRAQRVYWTQEREWRSSARAEGVDQRQDRQRQRIWSGWRAGELSRGEMRDLLAEQRTIEHKQRSYLADGHLSRWELADLERDLDSASRRIYHAKHDGDWRDRRD